MEQEIAVKPYAGLPSGFERNETHSSGVSWPAVIAGTFVTAALSLALLALGAGLGLSAVSPWSNVGASGSTIGRSAIIWLIAMEIISSSMGGYLAGRLRTKWASIHTDEVYFRDTAHGFLSWSTALVLTAAFLASAATSMIGSSISSSNQSTAASQIEGQSIYSNAYFVDTMFRTDASKPDTANDSLRSEVGIIFARDLTKGSLSTADETYLSQLVSATTGLSQGDADKRVSGVFADAQQAAEATRKAVAHSLLWVFLALLIGAFCASLSATIGGRQRDHVVTI